MCVVLDYVCYKYDIHKDDKLDKDVNMFEYKVVINIVHFIDYKKCNTNHAGDDPSGHAYDVAEMNEKKYSVSMR